MLSRTLKSRLSKHLLFRQFSYVAQAGLSPREDGANVLSSFVLADKYMNVEWVDGKTARYHFAWLRDNDPNGITSSNQKAPRRIDVHCPSNIPVAAEIVAQSEQSQTGVQVTWETTEGNQIAFFESDWLRRFAHENEVFDAKNQTLKAQNDRLDENSRNIFQPFGDLLNSENEQYQWLKCINEKGLCVLRNVPQIEDTVLQVSGIIGPPSHTIYGDTFSVKVEENPINIAYSDAPLEFHMDLAYFESPPGIQFLHAIEFDESIIGGHSTFIDAHAVAEELKKRNVDAFNTLCRIPATFIKDHTDREEPVQLFYKRPHINTNFEGEVTNVFWAPPFEGTLHVPFGEVEEYYEAYALFRDLLISDEMMEAYGFEFRLAPGDLVAFNNRRMLHGRTAFSSSNGRRHLQGTYLDIDRFLNKLRLMGLSRESNGYGSGYWEKSEKRVGTSCMR